MSIRSLSPHQFEHFQSADWEGESMGHVVEMRYDASDKVDSIEEHLRTGGSLPPVKVDFDTEPPTLVDGHHRWAAASRTHGVLDVVPGKKLT